MAFHDANSASYKAQHGEIYACDPQWGDRSLLVDPDHHPLLTDESGGGVISEDEPVIMLSPDETEKVFHDRFDPAVNEFRRRVLIAQQRTRHPGTVYVGYPEDTSDIVLNIIIGELQALSWKVTDGHDLRGNPQLTLTKQGGRWSR